MRKLLVATHERFASGIMETFKLIMGENEKNFRNQCIC